MSPLHPVFEDALRPFAPQEDQSEIEESGAEPDDYDYDDGPTDLECDFAAADYLAWVTRDRE
jgi:hypothetical protein